MADGEKLLTDEEMQAIEEVVASGDLEGDGYNVGVSAESFDLTSKDNRPSFDTTVLEQINERFHRHLRIGLLRELKYSADVAMGTVEVMNYGDYIRNLPSPVSLNLTNMSPLKGESICLSTHKWCSVASTTGWRNTVAAKCRQRGTWIQRH